MFIKNEDIVNYQSQCPLCGSLCDPTIERAIKIDEEISKPAPVQFGSWEYDGGYNEAKAECDKYRAKIEVGSVISNEYFCKHCNFLFRIDK